MSNYYTKNKTKIKANKWRYNEYEKLFKEKDIMINNNIDPTQFINETSNNIELEYNNKINSINPNSKNIEKDAAIKDIIKTKNILNDKGYSKDFIDNYMLKEYNKIIKNYYNESIDFID